MDAPTDSPLWPALAYDDWKSTQATLHLWTQIIGKVRLTQTPWMNHSWHSTLYVTARGLTTSPIPQGSRIFEIDFDFIDHQVLIRTGEGAVETLKLAPRSVADFYGELFARLQALGLDVKIHTTPNEIPDPIPFERDETHATYEPEAARRFFGALSQADRVFKAFRSHFIGKCSPVHFFWGSFDLAVTRFSGRPAPPHPGGVPHLPDWVAREAYSHEVISCGFWPGGDPVPYPVFYAYAYPEPAGFRSAALTPAGARYNPDLGEFLLPYEEIRQAASPDEMLMSFLQSSYEAAADRAGWDRPALERSWER
jgi:hypothetical protein